MAEKPKCYLCGKDAIGFQSLEGGFEYVCQDHAHSLLLELKPGEKNLSVFAPSNDTDNRYPIVFANNDGCISLQRRILLKGITGAGSHRTRCR